MDTQTKFWILIGAIIIIIICIRTFVKNNKKFVSLLLDSNSHESSENDSTENFRFRILECDIELFGSQDIKTHILIDKETNVQYLVLGESMDPKGITPLLCENGEPILYEYGQRPRRFYIVEDSPNNLGLDDIVNHVNIVIDTETTVQYMILGDFKNPMGITPLLCEDGSPILYEGDLDEVEFNEDYDDENFD